ncbi:MAG: 30S ribosomal protein S9, partial [Verrucomicrobia bacterium]|nr:30S ribosomal protein S9 [Verrucomicrobiota bacterium]
MVQAKQEYTATGRRKTSVARVWLRPGTGEILVNRRAVREFFPNEATICYIAQPLKLTNTSETYDIFAMVKGGGIIGQAGALRHAISRALASVEMAHREVLKDAGCLTRDARMKERKKPGLHGARRGT